MKAGSLLLFTDITHLVHLPWLKLEMGGALEEVKFDNRGVRGVTQHSPC